MAKTRRPFFRRRKSCPFTGVNAPKIDFKDVRLLSRYISERGKIVPSRITAVSTRALPCLAALRHCDLMRNGTSPLMGPCPGHL